MDNEAVIEIEAHFLPHVKSLYATTAKVFTSIDDVVKLLVQAIASNERNKADVSCVKVKKQTSITSIDGRLAIVARILTKIKIPRQNGPTEIGTCCCHDSALVTKLTKKGAKRFHLVRYAR